MNFECLAQTSYFFDQYVRECIYNISIPIPLLLVTSNNSSSSPLETVISGNYVPRTALDEIVK